MKRIWQAGVLVACSFSLPLTAVSHACDDDQGQSDTGNGNATTYVREARVTYFGIGKDQAKELTTRKDLTVCHVKYQDNVITSDEHSLVFLGDSKTTVVNPAGILHATLRYNVSDGPLPVFSKEVKEAFVSDMPYVGFELFYLPMLRKNGNAPEVNTEKVVALRTKEQQTPEFSGVWSFDVVQNKDEIQISGPVETETKDGNCCISGYLRHEVRLNPLRVDRMSGDLLVRIRPPANDLLPASRTHAGNEKWFTKFDKVVGHFQYRMVPIDSVEAKAISIPRELLSAVGLKEAEKSKE